jgi:8-oxo-dGTP pyrophosphatase MutT (NUDIX family)
MKYIKANFRNDSEYSSLKLSKKDIIIKHHLMFFLRRLNILYKTLKKNKYKSSTPLYLLLLVKKGINRYYIDIPGGKREIGESSMQAAEREFFEETGIEKSAFGIDFFLSDENVKIEIDKMDIYLKINQKSEFSES